MTEIVDLSAYQPTSIDYAAMKRDGVEGVMCKASDGIRSPDRTFAMNAILTRIAGHVSGCRAVGLPVGGYHYLRVRHGRDQDADRQAAEFCGLYLGHDCELWPGVDAEDTGNEGATVDEWLTAIRAFGATVERLLGCLPMLYTYPWFWHSLGPQVAAATDLGAWRLWWAEYGVAVPRPLAPWAGSSPLLWQYSGTGTLAGISGHIDRSRAVGGIATLRRPNPLASTPSPDSADCA